MNKPHKHAEIIKAWADGAEIEGRNSDYCKWEYVSSPRWCEDSQYRVKPAEPEKVYPVTQIKWKEAHDIYQAARAGESGWDDLLDVANAALRHAVDNAYLVTPETAQAKADEYYNRGMNDALASLPAVWSSERDQKIAEAVYFAAQNLIEVKFQYVVGEAKRVILAELLESLPAIVKEATK